MTLMNEAENVLYWDASAVISTLVRDVHSDNALTIFKSAATHLVSTLAHAEICAVIARLFHSGSVDRIIVQGILNDYNNGPWQEILSQPEREELAILAMKVSLRGADLWHIACVNTLGLGKK